MTSPAQINNASTTVVVSAESLAEGDSSVVRSNATVVHSMLNGLLTEDEIAINALRSYYVDFYLTQVLNGGFAQFVYNSGWSEEINARIGEGLELMETGGHRELFARAIAVFEELTEDERDYFFEAGFFEDEDDDEEADEVGDDDEDMPGIFDDLDEDFYELIESHDLTAANAAWLRSLPELTPMPDAEIGAFVAVRIGAITDLDDRREALTMVLEAQMPECERIIRVLVDIAGHELDDITVGDPDFEWEGERTMGWHFHTDEGEFIMVEAGETALMIDSVTLEVVAAIEFEDADGAGALA